MLTFFDMPGDHPQKHQHRAATIAVLQRTVHCLVLVAESLMFRNQCKCLNCLYRTCSCFDLCHCTVLLFRLIVRCSYSLCQRWCKRVGAAIIIMCNKTFERHHTQRIDHDRHCASSQPTGNTVVVDKPCSNKSLANYLSAP